MSQPPVHLVPDEGLGNTAYLLDLGDGRALAVDLPRDVRPAYGVARRAGLTIAYAADTHLHADFLTGSLEVARRDGATLLASAAGEREYPHTGLRDGDEVDLGGLRLRTLATPGHTDEHVALEVLDDNRTVGIFTGGSLIVGAAARTDLVDPERAEELARAQYRSLQRLACYDDDVAVWPTHGGGSFCSVQVRGEPTTTVGAERTANALLAAPDEDTFVRLLLDSLGSYPPYFHRLAEVNRCGPAPVHSPHLASLAPAEVQVAMHAGVTVVDARPVSDFAAGHIPGSVSIPLRPVFASWLGWLVDFDASVIVVRNPDQDADDIWWQAAKIGFEGLRGQVDDGLAAWLAGGLPTATIPVVSASEVTGRAVIDIRQRAEFADGHLPGAHHVELGALADALPGTPGVPSASRHDPAVLEAVRSIDASAEPTVVMCGHGERAMGAASLLARAGHTNLAVLDGGPDTWADVTGTVLSTDAPTHPAGTKKDVPHP